MVNFPRPGRVVLCRPTLLLLRARRPCSSSVVMGPRVGLQLLLALGLQELGAVARAADSAAAPRSAAALKAEGAGALKSLRLPATDTGGPPRICEHSGTNALSAVRSGPCPSGSRSIHIAGANLFDQLWVGSSGMGTCCNATGGAATYADARASLSSAHASGIRVFRFFAMLFGGSMAFWLKSPDVFWAEFDRLLDDVEGFGMYVIPSIGTGQWQEVANLVTPGLNETENDSVMNSSSVSYKLGLRYFDEITSRYANRSAVLFWYSRLASLASLSSPAPRSPPPRPYAPYCRELGNELNLNPNLPPPWCGPTPQSGTQRCFDNDALVAYTTALVSAIRRNDPVRPVSSGFGLAPPNAWHREHCWKASPPPGCAGGPPPAGGGLPGGGFWGQDTKEQWLETYAYQQSAVDIWSAHHYMPASLPQGCYFSNDKTNCTWDASLLAVVADAAKKAGKMLYVGEYGGPGPDFTGPTVANQSFPKSVLDLQTSDAQAGGVFSVSTIWAWACPSHRRDMVCIWPGSTRPKEAGSSAMVKVISGANAAMAAAAPAPAASMHVL
jgi:hypothetical protein